jgi:hypothetical protein
MTVSIWKQRCEIWDEALKAQNTLVELRDAGYIDAGTCADECLKLYDEAVEKTTDKENDDD